MSRREGDRSAMPQASLLNLVPYLLGFHPDNSAVVIGLKGPLGSPCLTVRMPLRYPGLAAYCAGHVVRILTAQEYARAVVVGYGPEEQVTPFTGSFRDLAAAHDIEVLEILRVTGGSFWSSLTDPAFGSLEGTPYEPAADPGLARMLPAGALSVLANRQELAALIAPVTGAEAAAMRRAIRRSEERLTGLLLRPPRPGGQPSGRALVIAEGIKAAQEAIASFQQGGGITPGRAAWLIVSLREAQVRDDFWSRLEPEGRQGNLRLLTTLTRLARTPYVTPVATLLAFVAWQCGNGALANLGLDRALGDDPDCELAKAIRQAVDAGAPPALARPPLTPGQVAEEHARRAAAGEAASARSGNDLEQVVQAALLKAATEP